MFSNMALIGLPMRCAVTACSGGGDSRVPDASPSGSDAETPNTSRALPTSPLCQSTYPAHACDGDPHGKWTLVAMCFDAFED